MFRNIESKIQSKHVQVLVFVLPLSIFVVYTFVSQSFPVTVRSEIYAHYLTAKLLFEYPEFLIHWYSRPFFTGLSGLLLKVLPFGLRTVQLLNSVSSALTCLFVYKLSIIIMKDRKYSILAVTLLLASPTFFAYAYSGLSEPLFALIVTAAIYFYYTRRYTLASFLVSLSTLTRLEGFFLVPFWIVFATLHSERHLTSRILDVFTLLCGPVLWLLVSGVLTGDVFWPLAMFVSENSRYYPFHPDFSLLLFYPILAITYMNVISLILFVIGALFSFKKKRNRFLLFHIFGLSLPSILLFIVIYSTAFHKIFAVHNSMRYFIGVLPLSAVVGAYGGRELYKWILNKRSSLSLRSRRAGFKRKENVLLVCMLLSVVLVSFTFSNEAVNMLPRNPSGRESLEKEVGEWLSRNLQPQSTEVYCSDDAIIYFSDLERLPSRLDRLQMWNPPNGSLIIWDSTYGPLEGISLDFFNTSTNYILVKSFQHSEYFEYAFDSLDPIHPIKLVETTFFVKVFRYVRYQS